MKYSFTVKALERLLAVAEEEERSASLRDLQWSRSWLAAQQGNRVQRFRRAVERVQDGVGSEDLGLTSDDILWILGHA